MKGVLAWIANRLLGVLFLIAVLAAAASIVFVLDLIFASTTDHPGCILGNSISESVARFLQIGLFAMAASILWGVPYAITRRARLRAASEGREPNDHWNTIFPYAAELRSSEKATIAASFFVAFAIGVVTVWLSACY